MEPWLHSAFPSVQLVLPHLEFSFLSWKVGPTCPHGTSTLTPVVQAGPKPNPSCNNVGTGLPGHILSR